MTKEYCKSIFLNENGKLIPQRTTEKYVKDKGLYEFIINYYSDSESLSESIYRICFDVDIRPVCKHCGGHVKYKIGSFSTFCSKKCVNSDPEVLQKNKENVSKSLKHAYEARSEEIKTKRSNTLKKKYNIETDNTISTFNIKQIQDNAKNTIYKKYGVNNVFKLSEYRSTRDIWQKKSVEYQKTRGYDIEYIKNELGEYQILVYNGCKIHGDIIVPLGVFNNRTKDDRKDYVVMCLDCNPLRSQTTSIEIVVKNILDELHIEYEQHDRIKIKPYELDFYIPKYDCAIECNGIFWHSGDKNKFAHKNKLNYCREKNIRLLYFWEDIIIDKPNLIKNYLKSVFGLNDKLYARNCEVKEVPTKEAKHFIDNNHLQGYVNSSIKLGLYHDNELVEIMTFGQNRICVGNKKIEGEYELYRFCSKGGITVVGGANKLLKHFIENYKPVKITTYSSNDISDGKIYELLGFDFIKETEPGYCYINAETHERRNRFSMRKDRIDDGSGRTADKILESRGWLKCYDTGNKRFELNVMSLT